MPTIHYTQGRRGLELIGRGILKLIGLALAGAIALACGAQLLSSVALVVFALRGGNFVPLFLVIGVTFLLIQLKRLMDQKALSAILGLFAYAAIGYLSLIAFVGLLPFGLITSLVGAALTIISCSIINDPGQLDEWIGLLSTDSPTSLLSRGFSSSNLPHNLDVGHHLIRVSSESRELIVTLMRNRPLLPISLTHFNECDVLFVDITSKRTTPAQIREILGKAGILTEGEVTPLLREAILKVPLIDEKHGLSISDYSIATEHDTVVQLMRNPPSRMIVFPSKNGPRILYPESDAPGLVSQIVPEREIVNALLLHEFSGLKEVKDTNENAT